MAPIRSDEPTQYGSASRTAQGEWVRSKGEKTIADYFTGHEIRYKYEIGVKTKHERYNRTFAKPDFYLPDFDLYVEYWGLAGSSEAYDQNTRAKAAMYHENGVRFISIYPEDLGNLDAAFKAKFRDTMGYPLPKGPPVKPNANFCAKCGAHVVPPGRFCVRCGSTVH